MREHQEARKRFIAEREVLQETKTPELISLKLLEEVGEFLVAYTDFARQKKTPERLQQVKEESADIMNLMLDVAIWCGFDMGEAVAGKIAKDSRRFPPETMKREKGKTPHEIYMRRKIALGERKAPVQKK